MFNTLHICTEAEADLCYGYICSGLANLWINLHHLGTRYLSRVLDSRLHSNKILILLSGNSGSNLVSHIKSMVREGLTGEWQKEFPSYRKEDLDFLFDYVFDGSMSLLTRWLNGDLCMSIEEFTKRMERLGHYSLVAVEDFM